MNTGSYRKDGIHYIITRRRHEILKRAGVMAQCEVSLRSWCKGVPISKVLAYGCPGCARGTGNTINTCYISSWFI